MEMERPWLLLGISGLKELPELEGGLMGEKGLLSWCDSELQEPELGLESPPRDKNKVKLIKLLTPLQCIS